MAIQIERRLDSRMFDELLPVHVDIDEISPTNRTVFYICGNVNVDLYNKNACGRLRKVIGGNYIFDKSVSKNKLDKKDPSNAEKKARLLLGSGKSSVVFTTIMGPVISGHISTKDRESSRISVRIKNIQGNRHEREKMFEEIVSRHLEKVINFGLYKYHQFHFKVQIVEECTYILSAIFNSVFFNLIQCGISLNYVFTAVNIGVVDREKYINFVNDRCASTNFLSKTDESLKGKMEKFGAAYEKYENKLFYPCEKDLYIPTVILDPLQEELDLYCSSAFTYVVAPDYNHIIGNIMILSKTGISKDISSVSDTYALQASKYMFRCITETYADSLRPVERYMTANAAKA